MTLPRCFAAALLVLTLGGCVSYQPKDLVPVITQARLEQRRLEDPGLARLLAVHRLEPRGEWDLAALTLAAFYFSPELEIAREQLATAEAELQRAAQRPNPTFTFTPGRSLDTAAGGTPWILGYALALPVELAGKRGHRTTESQHRAEQARLELASRAWSLHGAVRRALVELQNAEAEVALWQTQLPVVLQKAQLLGARADAGDGSPLETAAATATAARAELAASASRRNATLARSRLAETIGVPLAAVEGIRFSTSVFSVAAPLPPLAEARSWAAQNRADLLAALAAYAAMQAALQGEIARQYPDLTLGPGYQLDRGEGKWSLGLGLTLPAFHRNQGPIAAAEARRAVAAAQFQALQNRVLAEVDRAAADYASVLGDLDSIRALRVAIERQAALVQARHEAGESSRLDLVTVQLELADHARAELAVQQRAVVARGALEDAVQRPLAWPESAWRAPARLSGTK